MTADDTARLVEAFGTVWFTRREAAQFAHVSGDTVDRWRKQGLRHVGGGEHGRKILIRVDWLEDWLESQAHSHKDGQP